MKNEYWIGLAVVGGLIAAYFYSKSTNPANQNNVFSGVTDQRGTFGTDTGLYGASVAAGVGVVAGSPTIPGTFAGPIQGA